MDDAKYHTKICKVKDKNFIPAEDKHLKIM